MTACIKTSVNKNHAKNKIKQKTNSSYPDLLKHDKTQVRHFVFVIFFRKITTKTTFFFLY